MDSDWDFVREINYNDVEWTEELLDETLKNGIINMNTTNGKGHKYDIFYNEHNMIELINVETESIFKGNSYHGYQLEGAARYLNSTWVINDIRPTQHIKKHELT